MFGFGQPQSRGDFQQQPQSQTFGQNMNNFFSSIFNPSMGFMNPFQSSSQQQQQQSDSAFWGSNQSQQPSQPRHSNSQTFSSSQSNNVNNNNGNVNGRSNNGNNSNNQRSNQQTHQRFSSSQSSSSSSNQQQQPFSNRVPQQQSQQPQHRQHSSNNVSSSQQQQQQQNRNPNQQQQQQSQVPRSNNNNNNNNRQQDPQPSFRSTRSNWKKSEEDSHSTSKKKEQPKENTGEYWKQKGNEIFKKGFIDTAIEFYTRAINIDSSRSIFFSNRGRCYKIKKDLQRAFEDAVLAIELDDTNLKGHLLCGQVLCEMGKYEQGYAKIENGIKKLTKGLTLCASQAGEKKKQFEKEISVYIFRAKKLLYYKKNEEQKAKKTKLIENYRNYLDSMPSLPEEDKKQQFDDFVFTVGDPEKEKELIIPDYLCCKITLDLMVDPVTTEAGHTYEREVVENLFKKNGFIDPVTRNSVKQFLYPNLGVKQAVEDYLQENPWAFEHSYNENYLKIEF